MEGLDLAASRRLAPLVQARRVDALSTAIYVPSRFRTPLALADLRLR